VTVRWLVGYVLFWGENFLHWLTNHGLFPERFMVRICDRYDAWVTQ